MTEYIGLVLGNSAAFVIFMLACVGILGMIIILSKIHPKGSNNQIERQISGEATGEPSAKSALGTGKYHCMAYRNHPKWGPCVDFTTIPKPIGEIVMAETSCPMSGALYEVLEMSDGKITPYNEATHMPIVDDETPEFAWLCTHWESARRFWTVPKKWWQSLSNWYAVGMMVIAFIIVLATMGK